MRCKLKVCVDAFSIEVAIADLEVATREADVLIFVVPYQFIHSVCQQMKGKIKPTAIGVSLIKVRLPYFTKCFQIVSCLSLYLSVFMSLLLYFTFSLCV